MSDSTLYNSIINYDDVHGGANIMPAMKRRTLAYALGDWLIREQYKERMNVHPAAEALELARSMRSHLEHSRRVPREDIDFGLSCIVEHLETALNLKGEKHP